MGFNARRWRTGSDVVRAAVPRDSTRHSITFNSSSEYEIMNGFVFIQVYYVNYIDFIFSGSDWKLFPLQDAVARSIVSHSSFAPEQKHLVCATPILHLTGGFDCCFSKNYYSKSMRERCGSMF